MKRLFVSACMVVMLAMVPGCRAEAPKAEQAVTAMTDAFNELADRMAQIKTTSQFAEAEPDLQKIGEKITAATEQMKTLEQVPEAENKAIAEKLGPQMAAARRRFIVESERLNGIDPLARERIARLLGRKL